MNSLIIEDNASLLWRLQNYTSKQVELETAQTAAEGIAKAKTANYDVIVIDLGLPDKSGEEVLRAIREDGITTPVLILTAEMSTNTKVRLLEGGADDYLTKPFKIVELQARLKALSRRVPSPLQKSLIEVAGLTIDLDRRQVKRDGKEITLRRKEFDILECLVRNQGRIVTRSMILDRVWQNEKQAWNNTVDVHIKYLRDKIDRPFKTSLIKTAYGLGYMLDVK